MRFHLDADISQRVARIVRSLDPTVDITSAQELRHERVADRVELEQATAERRCPVTRNHRDFVPITLEYVQDGREHAGVVLVPNRLRNDDFSGIARAIVAYAHGHPDDAPPNFVDYLR